MTTHSKAAPSLLIYAPAARSGGPLRYLREALPLLCEEWPGTVHVAVPSESSCHLPDMSERITVTRLVRPEKQVAKVLTTQLQAWRLVHRVRPDVVFCLGNIAYVGPRTVCATLIQNAARLRDLRRPSAKTRLYIVALRALLQVTALRSKELVPVSKYAASVTPRWSGKSVTVVPHGIDRVPRLAINPPTRVDCDSVVVPGSIQPYRGYELAFAALARSDDTVRLSLIGSTDDRRYERYCRGLTRKLGIETRVDWVGPLSFDELWATMAACRSVLLTSRVEAFPNLMLEAAAANPSRPLLAMPFPWTDEFRDFFDCRPDSVVLASALEELTASSPTVVARREAALHRYNWSNTVSRLRSVLMDLAEHNATRL